MSDVAEGIAGEVEHADGINTVRGGGAIRAWNGIRYRSGMWAENVGSKELSMNGARIPSGVGAKAHAFPGPLCCERPEITHELTAATVMPGREVREP